MPIEINIYKRYSNAPGNARVVDGQNVNDESVAIEVELLGIESTGEAYSFNCPWCAKPYSAHRSERSLVLNCVKCGQQMMVTVEETGDMGPEVASARTTAYVSRETVPAPTEEADEPEWGTRGGVENFAPAVWIAVLIQPSVETFDSILKSVVPSAREAVIWMFLTGWFNGFVAVLTVAAKGLETTSYPHEVTYNIPMIAFIAVVLAGVQVVIFTYYALITHLVAKLFGGSGTDSELSYAMGAYLAPLSLISGILIIIPYIQWVVPLLIIYGLVLYVIAIKAVHKFGWDSAIASGIVAFAVSAIITGFVVIMLIANRL